MLIAWLRHIELARFLWMHGCDLQHGVPLDEGPPPRRFLARELDRVWPSVLRSSKDSVSFLLLVVIFPVDSRIFEPSISKLHLSHSPPSSRLLSTSLFLPLSRHQFLRITRSVAFASRGPTPGFLCP